MYELGSREGPGECRIAMVLSQPSVKNVFFVRLEVEDRPSVLAEFGDAENKGVHLHGQGCMH